MIFIKTLAFQLILFASFLTFSQEFGTMKINQNVPSGIITPILSIEDVGVVQFQIDNFSEEIGRVIVTEFKKYEGDIVNCGYSVSDNKVIVSYKDPIYPNYLLAILDRVNINGYYDLNGVEMRYFKDGRSGFIR